MSLRRALDRVASEAGLDATEVADELARALAEAAQAAWGPRELEVAWDEEADAVLVHQVVRVVDVVQPHEATRQVQVEDAAPYGGQVGDELLFQVFYRDEDGPLALAGQQPLPAGVLPSLEVLAEGLPLPANAPRWMADLWPRRRMPWRFGRPVVLPGLADAIDRLRGWLVEVEADVDVGGAGPAEVAEARRRAKTQDLGVLYERLGPAGADQPPLTLFGCPLLPLATALALQQAMVALVTEGHLPPSRWEPSWLPLFGGADSGTRWCLDLDTGAVVQWAEDGPAQPEAPALAAWLGVLALAAEAGLLSWTPALGVACSGSAWEAFLDLKARALRAG